MGVDKNSKIKEFTDKVCENIRFKEVHSEIKLELENHIEEIAEDYMSKGENEDTAVDKAILQMGDAKIIGKQLDKVHKPKPEWSIVIIAFIFAFIGLGVLYSIDATQLLGYDNGIYEKSIVWALIGIIIAVALYFFDYKKFQPYSKYIYFSTLLILILTNMRFNGTLYFMGINIIYITPFLFAIALSGMFESWDWNSLKGIIYGAALFVMPLTELFHFHSFAACVEYFFIFTILSYISGANLSYILGIVAGTIGTSIAEILKEEYRIKRYLDLINCNNDPEGAGWIYVQVKKLINSSSLLGNGFTLSGEELPAIHTDLIFSYVLYTFGWIVAVAIMFLVIAFIIRIFNISKVVKDSYGKSIIKSFVVIFTIQFAWNILMNFGLVPITAVSLPFISYGGTGMVMNMAAVGIISSVYRRRNISKESTKVKNININTHIKI